ncbi:MAG: class II D-tagatose-bisphosphate aldolase, non-catalytic subunit, partial [Actinobacteria bacterium]|nr:class II D-tagatose-bisphosphate aldolase, non-catalytic subunit [Actinomycetota bacterium]
DRAAAKGLADAIKKYRKLVFEGHSTDYQTSKALREMAEDGIAILKVGPALTFALREALFALSFMEDELLDGKIGIKSSGFRDVLEDAMLKNPDNWKKHYHGDARKLRLARKYSFSDRCRYYLPDEEVSKSIRKLINNLNSIEIPMTLISQYMPVQYMKIRNGELLNDPESLIKDRIINCIDDYSFKLD